ncbi:MAG: very short patch repair endonuclease [Ruminococcus flavefaciens]|nr:very short patch repair endonuclease [Ruminococcus flavefaciens]
MSRIKAKDTKIEVATRKYLFAEGFRYRKNDKRFPGKPDIVLPKYKTAIFVNGCFWHMHNGCKYGRLPKSNIDYWKEKLEKNAKNDAIHIQQIRDMGWNVIILWECELKKDFKGSMNTVVAQLKNNTD